MEANNIISHIREGKESKALLELYRYYPKVEKMVLSNNGVREDAQDLFQEALLIFCKKVYLPEFTFSSAPQTFLFGICKGLWNNQLRKRKHETMPMEEVQVTYEPDEEQEEKMLLAESALNALGKKCLEILDLFYYQKLDMAAVAKALGFSSAKSARNQKYKCIERAKNTYLKQIQSLQN